MNLRQDFAVPKFPTFAAFIFLCRNRFRICTVAVDMHSLQTVRTVRRPYIHVRFMAQGAKPRTC